MTKKAHKAALEFVGFSFDHMSKIINDEMSKMCIRKILHNVAVHVSISLF